MAHRLDFRHGQYLRDLVNPTACNVSSVRCARLERFDRKVNHNFRCLRQSYLASVRQRLALPFLVHFAADFVPLPTVRWFLDGRQCERAGRCFVRECGGIGGEVGRGRCERCLCGVNYRCGVRLRCSRRAAKHIPCGKTAGLCLRRLRGLNGADPSDSSRPSPSPSPA